MNPAVKKLKAPLIIQPDAAPQITVQSWSHPSVWHLPVDKCLLARILAEMALECVKMGERLGKIDLYLCDDAQIAWFNKNRLHISGPTNILSFPEENGNGTMLLSLDALHRECRIYNQEPHYYCLRLLGHGLAHLAGHEHGPRLDFLSNCCLQKGLYVLSCAASYGGS